MNSFIVKRNGKCEYIIKTDYSAEEMAEIIESVKEQYAESDDQEYGIDFCEHLMHYIDNWNGNRFGTYIDLEFATEIDLED